MSNALDDVRGEDGEGAEVLEIELLGIQVPTKRLNVLAVVLVLGGEEPGGLVLEGFGTEEKLRKTYRKHAKERKVRRREGAPRSLELVEEEVETEAEELGADGEAMNEGGVEVDEVVHEAGDELLYLAVLEEHRFLGRNE